MDTFQTPPTARSLVLASASHYRRGLLARLGLPFEQCAPEIDEKAEPGESAAGLVRRLAEAKARALLNDWPDALIIGSDQVGELNGRILGKPGSIEAAVAQLTRASAQTVTFYTGLCLLDSASVDVALDVVQFIVRFRALSEVEIRQYVMRDMPLDCAGSFRVEGLGIALFDTLDGPDPTALQGLPLIRLCAMLTEAGVEVLGPVGH